MGFGCCYEVPPQLSYSSFFSATVGNLQAKVESLTTTNALMKEDLAIARNSLLALQAENQAMRQSTSAGDNNSTGSGGSSDKDKEKASEELVEERRKNSELEKELKLQVSLKAESDMAMKLLAANASPDCPPAVEVAATPVEEAAWTSPTMVLWQLKTLSAAGCATWSIVAPRHSASPSRTPSRSTRVLASSPSGRISVGRFLLPLLPSTLLLCSFSSFLVRLQGPYKSEELEESSHHILEASDFSTLLVFLKYCFLLTFLSFFVRYWHLFIV